MYCHKCGKEILEDAKFCSFCGVGINQTKEKITELEKNDDISPEKQDKKRKTFKTIKIIVLILAFIAPSVSKNEVLLLDGIINIFIWLFIFYIISLFVFHKKTVKDVKKIKKEESELEKEIHRERFKRIICLILLIFFIPVFLMAIYSIFYNNYDVDYFLFYFVILILDVGLIISFVKINKRIKSLKNK